MKDTLGIPVHLAPKRPAICRVSVMSNGKEFKQDDMCDVHAIIAAGMEGITHGSAEVIAVYDRAAMDRVDEELKDANFKINYRKENLA